MEKISDDLLEGKSRKWKTVKGMVEIGGKEVEVSYREKVIELPIHRQQETGIKRIRRRELISPLPKDFYLPAEHFDGLEVVSETFKDGKSTKEYKHATRDYPPAYSFNSKFDNVYKFLTNNIYPSPSTLVHAMNWTLGARIQGHGLAESKKGQEDIKQFKNEGMYLQEIYHPNKKKIKSSSTFLKSESELYFAYGDESYVKYYATPVFIFGQKNRNFTNYLHATNISSKIFGPHGKGLHTYISLKEGPSVPKLRWCHADAAIIPTKRGLNVLFFETGNENEPQEEESSHNKSLEQRVSAFIGIAGIGASLFFLGSSVTGNAIGNLNTTSGNWIGIVLLLIGIVGAFWYFHKK